MATRGMLHTDISAIEETQMPRTDELTGDGGPPACDPDSQMIQAVLNGIEAYRVLVERYERRIYYVVYGMVRDPEDARDLAQDCFVEAFQNLHRFRLESKFTRGSAVSA